MDLRETMPKLTLIVTMMKTTKNFWQVVNLKSGSQTRRIVFRNGVAMMLDLVDYRKMRDLFLYLNDQKLTVKKCNGGFIVNKKNPSFSCSVPSVKSLPFFRFLLALANQNWNIRQIDASIFKVDKTPLYYEIKKLGDNLFAAKSERITLMGPVESLMAYFLECTKGVYDYDYNGKTVLDIGGFCGETAVFFASKGAKKVIVYEPVKMHHELIRKNVKLNRVNAELHQEGIGEKNGELSITYEETGLGFGLPSNGKKTITIEIKSAADIIIQSKADVAKIDCEGAEISLVNVPSDVLGLIVFYMVETHTKSIQEAVTKKFIESGFSQARVPKHLENEIYVVYFQKN
jgi:FkbM family methyltransferase